MLSQSLREYHTYNLYINHFLISFLIKIMEMEIITTYCWEKNVSLKLHLILTCISSPKLKYLSLSQKHIVWNKHEPGQNEKRAFKSKPVLKWKHHFQIQQLKLLWKQQKHIWHFYDLEYFFYKNCLIDTIGAIVIILLIKLSEDRKSDPKAHNLCLII